MKMEDDAAGHRYGNFPNYYSFNPPKNRLDVLKRSGILDFILSGLNDKNASHAPGDGSEEEVVTALVADGGQRKKPRLNGDTVENLSAASYHNPYNKTHSVNYCDLGCNEGDLTVEMAEFLSQGTAPEGEDVTTNEPATRELKHKVKCLGLDIDSKLIARANSKYCNTTSPSNNKKLAESNIGHNANICLNENINATFRTADLCSESEHNAAVMAFLDPCTSETKDGGTATTQQIFDLTTIFSTTMWIHVHGGDEGLKSFLERACGWTKKFLLVEPQPSGCYRKANVRLRKMGLPELQDVTSSRLKLRPAIEEEIEKVIIGAGFHRVHLKVAAGADAQNSEEGEPSRSERTDWNRALHLYQRI